MGLAQFVDGAFGRTHVERALARSRVWAALSDEARQAPRQWLGRWSTGCWATHSVMERCDFGCKACYLATTANQTPPLPFERVLEQLQHVRRVGGPGANLQITSGEVTLLPCESLARIVRQARALDLDPMVMTHGQIFQRDPGYLHALMHAGLEKIAVHVDTTQRGRDGIPSTATERDLMTVRDALAGIVRDARRTTGRTLRAAHTVTVTPDNLADVPAITSWVVDNIDAFRMVSFQPLADVGRTAAAGSGSLDVWSGVQQALGIPLNPHAFTMGHPACNRVGLALVVKFAGQRHFVEPVRADAPQDARFLEAALDSPLGGIRTEGVSRSFAAGQLVANALRSPRVLAQALPVGLRRIATLPWFPRFVWELARGRATVHPLIVVVHSFMGRDELDTPTGRARLDACSFKVPVGGRMVSMCELNGTDMRRRENEALIQLGRASTRLSRA